MRIFILTWIILSFISCFGAYYISIGDNSDLNNSIVSTGGGNNYYHKPLNEILADAAYSADPVVKGFVHMLKKYQQNPSSGQIDAFRHVKANTPFENIRLKFSVFDGTNAILFFSVISEKNGLEHLPQWAFGTANG